MTTTEASQRSADRWIRCGTLVSGRGDEPQRDVALRIGDGVIQEVRPWQSADARGDVVDLSGHTVAPGFVDAHVHLLFTCDVDHQVTRATVESDSDAELALTGAQNAVECLLGGVTTVRDCGDRGYVTLRLRDAVAAGAVPGPRILAAGPPVTTTGGHLHWCGNTADSPDEIRRVTRQLCASGVDVVKVMASGGNMTLGSNARQPQFATDELRIVVSEAHRLGRRVAAHASNTESIRRSVAAGVDTVEHCLWRSPQGETQVDLEVVAEMARRGTWVSLTMAGIARLLLPDYDGADPAAHEIALSSSPSGGDLHADHAWARTLRESGVRIALSSDAGVRFTPFRRFDQTLRCGIEALSCSASEAIGLATLSAAEALGISDEVGSIEVGKEADLVVLEGLTKPSSTEVGRVRQVWKGGRLIVHEGHLTWEPPGTSAASGLEGDCCG